MWTKEKIAETAKVCIKNLDKYQDWLIKEREDLKKHFFQNYNYWDLHQEQHKITCDETGFDKLLNISLDYISKQKIFIEKILSLDIAKENKFNRQIIVDNRNYEKLLIICNLKTEITRGLANRYLDSNYEIKALQQIQTNEELKKLLKEKYFA